MAKKLTVLPSNLSFRRSMEVSEGNLGAVLADGSVIPVEVTSMKIRGAIASYNVGYDKKANKLKDDVMQREANKPNLQVIDVAHLPPESDTLSLEFFATFIPASLVPDACNNKEFARLLGNFVVAAKATDLYHDLAWRYIWNVANARALWRNGYGTDKVVTITDLDDKAAKWVFEASRIDQRSCPSYDEIKAAIVNGASFQALTRKVANGLSGEGPIARFQVVTTVRTYNGAEVWPSQEFVEESRKARDGEEISRVLSSREVTRDGRRFRHATMHSQKIGNALRTIDEWHGNDEYNAVPVEAFGWVQRDLLTIRKPVENKDAYSILMDIERLTDSLRANDVAARSDALYALAMLIRGGVYGMKEEKEAKESAE